MGSSMIYGSTQVGNVDLDPEAMVQPGHGIVYIKGRGDKKGLSGWIIQAKLTAKSFLWFC